MCDETFTRCPRAASVADFVSVSKRSACRALAGRFCILAYTGLVGLHDQRLDDRRRGTGQVHPQPQHLATPEQLLDACWMHRQCLFAVFFADEHVLVRFLRRYRHEDLAAHAERRIGVVRFLGDGVQRQRMPADIGDLHGAPGVRRRVS